MTDWARWVFRDISVNVSSHDSMSIEAGSTREISIGDFTVGGDHPLFLISGPCGIESQNLVEEVAGRMQEITESLNISYIFKSSYDKANRTSIGSFRGPGMEEGLRILDELKQQTGLPVLTDVHCKTQVKSVAEVVDVLQIPAFLCRQTDLVTAAAETGKVMNVKKGQFLSPFDVKHILEKARSQGNDQVLFTERGTTFGYGNLVNDMRSVPIMKKTGSPVVYDATHSAQLPGSGDGYTGGAREYIPALSRAAVAAGCNGLFMEVHPEPKRAKSDSATQYPLEEVKELLESLIQVRESLS